MNKLNTIMVVVLLLIGINQITYAQVKPNLGNTSRLMNAAISAMESGDYEKANHHFREIINSNIPIPPEMPYYFAETLFHLKQYDNSANFLKKYLNLNGFKGEHYEEAKQLEATLAIPLKEIKECELCDRRGYRLVTCSTCEGTREVEQTCSLCKGKGIVGCSRCAGNGLVTKKNVFNIVEYFECERCQGNGRLTCPKCGGTHIEMSDCRTCMGSGKIHSEDLCDHKGSDQGFNPRTSFLNMSQLFHSHP